MMAEMRNMEFYKETNFKEVDLNGRKVKIPEEWKVVKLGEILEIRKRAPQSKITKVKKVAVIPMEKIPQNSKLFTEFDLKELNSVRSFTYCEAGDLLLAKITPSFENGKQGLVPYSIPGGFALATTEVYPLAIQDKNCDSIFIFYILKCRKFRKILEARMSGTTGRKRVQKRDLLNLKIPLPPIEEQRKIAEVLRTIDEAIEQVEKGIEKLERMKKGAMDHLLTRGIGHTKFKEVDLNGRKVKIPEEWKVVRLGDIAKEMYYGVTAKAVDYKTNLRMLRTTDIFNYQVNWEKLPFCRITEKRNDYTKYFIRKGDLLIARAGTVGVSVLAEKEFNDVVFGSYLIKIKLRDEALPKFVHYYLQSDFYWYHINKAQGSTLRNVNLSLLRSLCLPLPPIEEQRKIAEVLRTIDEAIETKKQKKEKLEMLKKAVMEKLLTGEVRIKRTKR